ncbi:uncharacterized protein PAC_09489 [Phialocephala subalpina]|uniref:Only prolin and serin are matching in the corresponding protein n=1 Tax=Phialocephala subalpina TaxID=576137 RepID=A0A1L7X3K8_9HELO|nr:uncharacterized protein PAC_09489 [Phialocephala subalpina]
MSPKLKPLLLPQLVEERRKRESMSDSEMDFSSSFYTQNSSASEIPSPVTPTFSARGHLRYPSSASSLESSYYNSAVDSPSSPTFVCSKTGKRSLPDVQEEPHDERDEDFDMFEDANELYDCLCDSKECLHRDASLAQSSVQLSTKQEFDYDLTDGFFSDGEFSSSPRTKKRRAVESPLTGLANRFGTRFPSFSRKWRTRKGASSTSLTSDAQRESAASRGASSRSSSVSNPGQQTLEKSFEPQLPPTPTKSVFDGREGNQATSIDIEKANGSIDEPDAPFASTPLLPPLMMDASANKAVSMQSPLQSPSVAEPNDPFSGNVTPIDAITTPQLPGMPSPPLSTKPSISSFHRNNPNRPGHLIPSSEIPPIVIADPDDEWANKLGHANFTIYPEPYLPESYDLEACRQLRANWDLARCNYTKHLVRTGEHYGVTSKTYKLTEEKWTATDAAWRRNNEITITNTVESGSDAFATLKHNTLGDNSNSNIMTKIPSLNDPRSGGKFPQLGDEDIVGPMVQVAAQLQRSPSKKAKLFKFFAEKFPVGLGRS